MMMDETYNQYPDYDAINAMLAVEEVERLRAALAAPERNERRHREIDALIELEVLGGDPFDVYEMDYRRAGPDGDEVPVRDGGVLDTCPHWSSDYFGHFSWLLKERGWRVLIEVNELMKITATAPDGRIGRYDGNELDYGVCVAVLRAIGELD